MADYCCMNMGVKTAMKKLNAAGPDAVVCMSCGDGVQVAAAHSPSAPVYPSNNTMFLGEAVRFGLFEEACHLCGDCVLGTTGGIWARPEIQGETERIRASGYCSFR